MREKIETREFVVGYYAEDGSYFRDKDECIKYEESAKGVIYNMVKPYLVGLTDPYSLFNGGYSDSKVEIFFVQDINTVELLNRYIALNVDKCYLDGREYVTEKMIGKEVFIEWTYDGDYCTVHGTMEDIFAHIQAEYEKAKKNIEE